MHVLPVHHHVTLGIYAEHRLAAWINLWIRPCWDFRITQIDYYIIPWPSSAIHYTLDCNQEGQQIKVW